MPFVKLVPVTTEFTTNLSDYEDESMKVQGDTSYKEKSTLI